MFLVALAAFCLALKAIFDARRVKAQLAGLTEQFSGLDRRLVGLAEDVGLIRAASPPGAAPPTTEIAPAVAISPEPPPIVDEAESPPEQAAIPAEPPAVPEEPTAAPAASVPQPISAPGRGWEQKLVEHWLVWLGGAAMALGGAFLVKLSIDQGLLTPLVRVVLGILLGIGLSVGAEWARRRELVEDARSGGASYVPQALAAAGAATVFASLYAAHALYGFLPSGLAFPLLAATAGATVLQSLRYGPLVAALGLVGAFVVPLLVTSSAQ